MPKAFYEVGFNEIQAYLNTKPEKSGGKPEQWSAAPAEYGSPRPLRQPGVLLQRINRTLCRGHSRSGFRRSRQL